MGGVWPGGFSAATQLPLLSEPLVRVPCPRTRLAEVNCGGGAGRARPGPAHVPAGEERGGWGAHGCTERMRLRSGGGLGKTGWALWLFGLYRPGAARLLVGGAEGWQLPATLL